MPCVHATAHVRTPVRTTASLPASRRRWAGAPAGCTCQPACTACAVAAGRRSARARYLPLAARVVRLPRGWCVMASSVSKFCVFARKSLKLPRLSRIAPQPHFSQGCRKSQPHRPSCCKSSKNDFRTRSPTFVLRLWRSRRSWLRVLGTQSSRPPSRRTCCSSQSTARGSRACVSRSRRCPEAEEPPRRQTPLLQPAQWP